MTRTEELRAEAKALQRKAGILVAVADVADDVYAAMEAADCPNSACKECPAYVGHPGICFFVRLKGVVDAYLLREEEPPVQTSEPSPIIEVP